MPVLGTREASMGSIQKRSSFVPQTTVIVGIKLEQTNTILKYTRGDKRNLDVLPENTQIMLNMYLASAYSG